ncbi:hypothetical protein NLG97_g5465 [Lecanicillium saksenae]|uniref:Uncharacterized protein n=1 Tax=Lecanicillium saksenae TaxID=468837 RepID=A0ACC1QW72_9HYPO|nr:hypothetical protein NLG97_g5465 [Lecanicillium saksenae]
MFFCVAIAVVAGTCLAHAASVPQMQVDPATVKDCVDWYDNDMSQTCKEARDMLKISPEEFNAWNPSVGLDCSHWYYASYCVLTQSKLDRLTATQTATPTATATTSPTLGPSPTSWESLGCYSSERKDGRSVMETRLSDAAGDSKLTLAQCQDSCYRRASRFAGVMGGNQCWCSNNVVGDLANNPKDCNLPCTGDDSQICGGKNALNVYRPVRDALTPIASSTPAATTTTSEKTDSRTSTTTTASPAASGASGSGSSGSTTMPYTIMLTALLILALA